MKKPFNYDTYLERTHWIGRIVSVLTLVMLVGAPFAIGGILGAMPDLAAAGRGFLAVGLIWAASSVVEYLVYTPMLGAGGSYLAFITGNLINMKSPCAMNAREMTGAKSGTAENEVISTLSIATSSLVTILVLALGVALMIPLQPVLRSPSLQPAFANVVPALFGALFTLVPSLISSASMMIIPAGAIAIGLSFLKWKKERKDMKGAAAE